MDGGWEKNPKMHVHLFANVLKKLMETFLNFFKSSWIFEMEFVGWTRFPQQNSLGNFVCSLGKVISLRELNSGTFYNFPPEEMISGSKGNATHKF